MQENNQINEQEVQVTVGIDKSKNILNRLLKTKRPAKDYQALLLSSAYLKGAIENLNGQLLGVKSEKRRARIVAKIKDYENRLANPATFELTVPTLPLSEEAQPAS